MEDCSADERLQQKTLCRRVRRTSRDVDEAARSRLLRGFSFLACRKRIMTSFSYKLSVINTLTARYAQVTDLSTKDAPDMQS